MSKARGLALQNALAAYLRTWWPSAESAGSGRPGTDIAGTPGIVWENKTAHAFRAYEWAKQAKGHARNGELPVVVYWPDGMGAASAADVLAIVPLGELVTMLVHERDSE